MRRFLVWRPEWVFYLCVSFLFGAAVLRSILLYYPIQNALILSLVLLSVWLILFISQPALSRHWHGYFPVYVVIQSGLAFVLLLFNPEPSDFFAVLFAILSAQAMIYFQPRQGALCIALFTPLTLFPLLRNMATTGMAIGVTLVYAASNALLAAYMLATRRAQAVHRQNQLTLKELEEANHQLQIYAKQVEQISVARERSRFARELHDSVTQSIFSMTLATQSALLLLQRDPRRAAEQLTRINDLAQGALTEMQTLISELSPRKNVREGLALALQRHIKERHLPEGLSIMVDVDDTQALSAVEEQGLFRIVQESLNNIVKHAAASQVTIRLRLAETSRLEIQDNGRGFDLPQALRSGGVGLSSMRERANEIGWTLKVDSTPGSGTHICLEKNGQPGLAEDSRIKPE